MINQFLEGKVRDEETKFMEEMGFKDPFKYKELEQDETPPVEEDSPRLEPSTPLFLRRQSKLAVANQPSVKNPSKVKETVDVFSSEIISSHDSLFTPTSRTSSGRKSLNFRGTTFGRRRNMSSASPTRK